MATEMTANVFDLNGEHPADRVARAQAITAEHVLDGDPPPTRRQIAAVMHALADHTHNMHMVGGAVTALGTDRADFGEAWVRATGLGRYFHALGDRLEETAPQTVAPVVPSPPEPSKDEVQDLLQFLAANADVARADGNTEKANRYRKLLDTVRSLAEHATVGSGAPRPTPAA